MTALALLLLFINLSSLALSAEAPQQPLPFSHKSHAGALKMKCKMCHLNPDPGEMMTIAPATTCMQCHATIKADSPAIQKLAEFAKNGREVKWVRVYQIPSYVIFSHRTHLEAGSKCEECHGKVEGRDQLFREADISMGGCMNCHRARKASIDCLSCHEQQPPNYLTRAAGVRRDYELTCYARCRPAVTITVRSSLFKKRNAIIGLHPWRPGD